MMHEPRGPSRGAPPAATSPILSDKSDVTPLMLSQVLKVVTRLVGNHWTLYLGTAD